MGIIGSGRRPRTILGINRRNIDFVLARNPRANFPLVDDKVKAKERLVEAKLPTPETFAVVETRGEIEAAIALLGNRDSFVAKPARSYGGRGILVVNLTSRGFEAGPDPLSEEDLAFHFASILSGMFALGDATDRVLVEEKLADATALKDVHGGGGVSDVRVIVCESEVVMAMLRLPCQASGATANLHAGGIGVGIGLDTGVTTHAIQARVPIEVHPDTDTRLSGVQVPHWEKILELTRPLNDVFGMGYLGADFVVDAARGPVILEVNARPGLDIQLANREGLLAKLQNQHLQA